MNPLILILPIVLLTSWLITGKFHALTQLRLKLWQRKKIRSYHDRKGNKLYVTTNNAQEENILDSCIHQTTSELNTDIKAHKNDKK